SDTSAVESSANKRRGHTEIPKPENPDGADHWRLLESDRGTIRMIHAALNWWKPRESNPRPERISDDQVTLRPSRYSPAAHARGHHILDRDLGRGEVSCNA